MASPAIEGLEYRWVLEWHGHKIRVMPFDFVSNFILFYEINTYLKFDLLNSLWVHKESNLSVLKNLSW